MDNIKIILAAEDENLLEKSEPINDVAWPEFMLHDPIANKYWAELYRSFALFQFNLFDTQADKFAVVANTVPFFYDGDLKDLPDSGWDWVINKAFEDLKNNIQPNMLSALSITIAPEYRNKRLSQPAIRTMVDIARSNNFTGLVAPVRPSQKSLYPNELMADYLQRKNEKGETFDPWIRTHQKLGGKIIKVCPQAMYIPGSLDEWEKWLGYRFETNGEVNIDGALVPVVVDLEQKRAEYTEPNVWMLHKL